MMLLGGSDGILVGFPVVEVNAGILLDGLDHRQAFPVTHIDLLALVGNLQAAADLEGQALVHLLDQIHHAVEVGKCLVQLDGRELGVMLGVHALVAVHVQGVVVGVEGAGGRADLERGQDGGVDLQEALFVQIGADFLQNQAALDKSILDLGVHDEVNVALAVTRLAVRQAVELLGQGQQTLGEQRQLGDADRNFAHLRAEHLALDADDVTDVQLLEGGVGFIAQQVTLDKNLDVALLVAQMGKAGLAHDALGHHAASQRDDLSGLRLGRKVSKLIFEVGRVRILRIFGDFKGVMTGFAQVCQLLAAHSGLLGQLLLGLGLILLHVRSSFRDF